MEAKEKAYEIFNKCCDYADYRDDDGCFTERETMYKNAKNLSLITIEEIIKVFYFINPNGEDLILLGELKYWNEVKQEIENIEIIENDIFKLPKKYTEEHLRNAYMQGKHGGKTQIYRDFNEFVSLLKT